jgi:predicted Rdx family selenoprotein
MATEIWHEFGSQTPVTIIPVADGRLEVDANGERLLDRKAEGGAYPEMKRIRELKQEIKRRLGSTVPA